MINGSRVKVILLQMDVKGVFLAIAVNSIDDTYLHFIWSWNGLSRWPRRPHVASSVERQIIIGS